MARLKLERVLDLDKARTRLAALKSIDPTLDFGDGITVAAFEAQVDLLAAKVGTYNTALSTVDDRYNDCLAQRDLVRDLHERVLTGVATKYGKKSSQYEMAGGVRKTERRKPKKDQK